GDADTDRSAPPPVDAAVAATGVDFASALTAIVAWTEAAVAVAIVARAAAATGLTAGRTAAADSLAPPLAPALAPPVATAAAGVAPAWLAGVTVRAGVAAVERGVEPARAARLFLVRATA